MILTNKVDELSETPKELIRLTRKRIVFHYDEEETKLLRFLGINAVPLKKVNLNLTREEQEQVKSERDLGLPNLEELLAIGSEYLCIGESKNTEWLENTRGLAYVPQFPPLPALTEKQSEALSIWLLKCVESKLKVIGINQKKHDRRILEYIGISFEDPISPGEVIEQSRLKGLSEKLNTTCVTKKPNIKIIYEKKSNRRAKAAICISSYNYETKIVNALESCKNQTIKEIELIVVDDNSNDGSVNRIKQWMMLNSDTFDRLVLIKHEFNGGLALQEIQLSVMQTLNGAGYWMQTTNRCRSH